MMYIDSSLRGWVVFCFIAHDEYFMLMFFLEGSENGNFFWFEEQEEECWDPKCSWRESDLDIHGY